MHPTTRKLPEQECCVREASSNKQELGRASWNKIIHNITYHNSCLVAFVFQTCRRIILSRFEGRMGGLGRDPARCLRLTLPAPRCGEVSRGMKSRRIQGRVSAFPRWSHLLVARDCPLCIRERCVSVDALLPKPFNQLQATRISQQSWASSSIFARNHITRAMKAAATVLDDPQSLSDLDVTLLPNCPMTSSQRSWCKSRRTHKMQHSSLVRDQPSARVVCYAT